MKKGRIADAVAAGRVLVSDGAWGTLLQKKGLTPGQCPELWCVDHPAEVLGIARAYIDAGADMVESNSFGGSRCTRNIKRDLRGYDDRAPCVLDLRASPPWLAETG